MTGQVTVTYFVVQNCLDNKSCLYWGWNYWLPCPVPRPLGSPFVTVLKKLWETDLPREALRLVEPVVSSFPFARHLRRFTCKPKHTITVHAYARVQCTEQKQPRHPTRERGMAEMGAKRTKFCRLTSVFRSQSDPQGPTATADANSRTSLA